MIRMGKKVVIWGLGRIGYNVISILGKENIEAIIESNPEKINMGSYLNIPIISFDKYREKYSDFCIIITPVKYQSIVNKLEEQKIGIYYIWVEEKIINIAYLMIDSIINEIKNVTDGKNVYLSGTSVFGKVLYEKLVSQKKNTYYLQDECHYELQKRLEQDGYPITYDEHLKNEVIIQLDESSSEYLNENNKVITYIDINNLSNSKWKREVQKYRNIALPDEEIFIVATGPSLLIDDLNKLSKEKKKCIGMNWLFKIFDKTEWRPDYYVISDQKMVVALDQLENREAILQNIQTFVSDAWLDFWKKKQPMNYIGYNMKYNSEQIKFSDDFSSVAYSGMTVMYICLQLAAFMGYKKIYILGCDFNYNNEGKQHCYEENKREADFDYEIVSRAYMVAKEYGEQHGIKIYNATRGGNLEIFERVDFNKLF